MLDKYLESGEVFSLYNDDLKSICVVSREKDAYEIKNLATYPKYQNQGYGKKLVTYIINYYKSKENERNTSKEDSNENSDKSSLKTIYVGTGDSKNIISFYEKLGFEKSHKVKNFFVDNYSKAIFENGKQLIDMIYLKRDL